MAGEPQKLCGILLADKSAVIRVKLDAPLPAGVSVNFSLVLQDLYRLTDLVPIAQATLSAGGATSVELPVQAVKAGLALAYAGDTFARVALRGSNSAGPARTGSAQLVIADATHAYPVQPFSIPLVPPLPPFPEPAQLQVWILGRGMTGLETTGRG